MYGGGVGSGVVELMVVSGSGVGSACGGGGAWVYGTQWRLWW